MINEQQVLDKLKNVVDPEIGLNIVDMGLIYDVRIEEGQVFLKMTLTAPGCPLQNTLIEAAELAVKNIEGIKNVRVDLVWDPPWHPSMMSDEAKKRLGFD